MEELKEDVEAANAIIAENASIVEEKLAEVEQRTANLSSAKKVREGELGKHVEKEDEVASRVSSSQDTLMTVDLQLTLAQQELSNLQGDEEAHKRKLTELTNRLAELEQNLEIKSRYVYKSPTFPFTVTCYCF